MHNDKIIGTILVMVSNYTLIIYTTTKIVVITYKYLKALKGKFIQAERDCLRSIYHKVPKITRKNMFNLNNLGGHFVLRGLDIQKTVY